MRARKDERERTTTATYNAKLKETERRETLKQLMNVKLESGLEAAGEHEQEVAAKWAQEIEHHKERQFLKHVNLNSCDISPAKKI